MRQNSQLIDHLEGEKLPRMIRQQFVFWCVMQQARPALALLLRDTTLAGAGAAMEDAEDLNTIRRLTEAIQQRADELRDHHPAGPVAAAALFEFANLVQTASSPNPDAGAGAFFAARVCGWRALVHHGMHHPARKLDAERHARRDQETILRRLLDGGNPAEDEGSAFVL